MNATSRSLFENIDYAPNNYGIDFLYWAGSKFSTDSSMDELRSVKENFLDSAFLLLKQDIGAELFNGLTYGDKIFMIETAGSVDLGKQVNLNDIYKNIKEYEP